MRAGQQIREVLSHVPFVDAMPQESTDGGRLDGHGGTAVSLPWLAPGAGFIPRPFAVQVGANMRQLDLVWFCHSLLIEPSNKGENLRRVRAQGVFCPAVLLLQGHQKAFERAVEHKIIESLRPWLREDSPSKQTRKMAAVIRRRPFLPALLPSQPRPDFLTQ